MTNNSGIVFEVRLQHFKLVDIEWGRDNSFYFMPRQHDAEVGQRIVAEHDDTGRLLLNIDQVQTGCFATRKISRHTSGYFHIKDVVGRGGKRETDGLVGPSFSQMGGFYTFLVICPQAIDTLVRVPAPEPTDVIVHLRESIEPFTVQFAVWDKRTRVKIPTATLESFLGGVITLDIDNLDYGLVMMFPDVKKTTPEIVNRFPSRTCYIVR